MTTCIICSLQLKGLQTMFCSKECKSKHHKKSNYQSQQKRGIQRKVELIKLKNYKCNRCGYNKNIAALDFHHIDPTTKIIPLDIRTLSTTSYEDILKEADKCILLCSNCHRELHHNDDKYLLENYDLTVKLDLSSKKIKSLNVCTQCNNIICNRNKSGLCISCSKSKPKYNLRKTGRPSKEILLEELKIHTYKELSKKYNVNPKTITKWKNKV